MTADEVINIIKDEYFSCPNVQNDGARIICGTWYRHDDCERLRKLILKLTGDTKYTFPKNKNGAVAKLVKAPNS
jgi:hypothetical protein